MLGVSKAIGERGLLGAGIWLTFPLWLVVVSLLLADSCVMLGLASDQE
jgi:hypothetical protein